MVVVRRLPLATSSPLLSSWKHSRRGGGPGDGRLSRLPMARLSCAVGRGYGDGNGNVGAGAGRGGNCSRRAEQLFWGHGFTLALSISPPQMIPCRHRPRNGEGGPAAPQCDCGSLAVDWGARHVYANGCCSHSAWLARPRSPRHALSGRANHLCRVPRSDRHSKCTHADQGPQPVHSRPTWGVMDDDSGRGG